MEAKAPEMGLFEVMYSARAIRRFRSDEIPDDIIERVLEAGTQAPSGGNRQEWRFLVITDPAQRSKIAAIYEKASRVVMAFYAQRGRPAHMGDDEYRRLMQAGTYLHHHMAQAPVLLLLCAQSAHVPIPEAAKAVEPQALINQIERTRCASVYPAMQNIMLACRAFGLAALPTTNHLLFESEVREALGIPAEIQT
jgi:nitroreductase